ncbi:MAG: hypothetical protein SWH68_10635 [Thermodesulfobacteriota bacterium]|nr:hypothetical protein [Thermodesulfobacteriota bacterium]
MEQQIHITLSFHLATGKVNLNEIVYQLKELQNPLMLGILKEILTSYDDLIADRLTHHGGVFPPSKARKGLGRHVRKNDPQDRFCHGRKIRKRGYRNRSKEIATVFGKLELPVRVAECRTCGAGSFLREHHILGRRLNYPDPVNLGHLRPFFAGKPGGWCRSVFRCCPGARFQRLGQCPGQKKQPDKNDEEMMNQKAFIHCYYAPGALRPALRVSGRRFVAAGNSPRRQEYLLILLCRPVAAFHIRDLQSN